MNATAAPLAPSASLPRRRIPIATLAITANVAALLAVAVVLRLWRLGSLPGINGDEAWYGVLAQRFLAGESIVWQTPTGNPINVFYFFPQIVLHWAFPASFTLLRVVAVISGLLVLPVNFWLARGTLGRRGAWISTCAFAVLPICIAYSRFAWDASQSVLAGILVVHFALRIVSQARHSIRWSLLTALALIGAVLVHPTNVFLTPVAGWTMAYRWRCELSRTFSRDRSGWTGRLILLFVFLFSSAVTWCVAEWRPEILMRFIWPAEAFAFASGVSGLFSGVTVYQFIPGTLSTDSALTKLAIAVHFLGFVACCAWAIRGFLANAERQPEILRVLWPGLALALLSFYLIAGPRGVAPHFERYAMWLVAPVVLALTLAAEASMGRSVRARTATTWGLLLLGWFLVAEFSLLYVRQLHITGGTSHVAFRTSDREPKEATLDLVRAQVARDSNIAIIANSWWCYWPLEYLAGQDPRIAVLSTHDDADKGLIELIGQGRQMFYVEFIDSEDYHVHRRQLKQIGIEYRENWIRDAQGRPLLSVMQVVGRPGL